MKSIFSESILAPRIVCGLLACCLIGSFTNTTFAQLAQYNPDSPSLSGTPTTFAPTLTGSNVLLTDFTRGTGLTAVSASGGFNASSWDGSSFATSMSGQDYYTFSIAPAANYSLSFTNITGGFSRSGTGASIGQWGTGLTATTGTALGSSGTISAGGGSTVSATLSSSGVTTGTEFRFAGWSATNASGTMRIETTVTLSGSATLRSAGTLVWDGGQGNGNWNSYNGFAANQSNWDVNYIPTTALVDSLQFAGSTQTSTNNNIAGLTVGSIAFNAGASAFTLAGNSLTLNSGITNNSTNLQTVNLNLTLGGAQTFDAASGNLAIGSTITNGSNLLTVTGSNNTTISGVIGGGSGGLTKNGNGTLTLSNANTYSGTTTVNAGTLAYGTSNAIAAGGVTVNGGALDVGTFNDTVGTVSLTGGTITGTTGVLSSTANFDMQNGIVSAILGGSVGLDKTTAGTVTLTKTNSYTGTTTVSAGTLAYGTSNAIASGGVTVNTGGTVNIGTFIDSVGSVMINGGTITGTTGVLSSTANFDGRSGTVSAILGGATGLDKSTGGTLVINSANTFSGATNINAGTLDLTGSLASVVNVNAGTLTGSGTINNDVNVFAGTVAPGTGPSTLTVTGDFNLSSGSTLSFELAGNNMTVGGGINDLVTSVVDLTLDGTLNVIELGAGSFLSAKFGDKWRIFNYSGSLTDLGLALGSMPSLAAGYSFRIDTSTFGQVNLIAVPEPSSVMALSALGVVGLLVLRRRRNRAA